MSLRSCLPLCAQTAGGAIDPAWAGVPSQADQQHDQGVGALGVALEVPPLAWGPALREALGALQGVVWGQ